MGASLEVHVENLTQPFVKLSTANAELIAAFAQSPEMTQLATTTAQKYVELARKSFGHSLESSAQADLVRRLSENYATFAKEYSEALVGITTDAQALISQQVIAATDRVSNVTDASVADVGRTSKSRKPPRQARLLDGSPEAADV